MLALELFLKQMAPADDVMKMMIDHMTNTSTSSHIDVKKGKFYDELFFMIFLLSLMLLANRKSD